jgi:hypothetical protein
MAKTRQLNREWGILPQQRPLRTWTGIASVRSHDPSIDYPTAIKPNGFGILIVSIVIGLAQSVFGLQSQLPADLSGLESNELYSIEDHAELTASDPNLVRMLFRASKTSEQNFVRFAKSNDKLTVQQVLANPRDHRACVVRLKGRVKRVWPVFIPGMDDNGPIAGFFLAKFEDQQGAEFLVAAPGSDEMLKGTEESKSDMGVPGKWPSKKDMDQNAECFAYFLAVYDLQKNHPLGQTDHEGPGNPRQPIGNVLDLHTTDVPLFVARRVAWYPDRTNESMDVTPDEVLLAAHGLDVGQFDRVRANNNRHLSSGESQCFYEMLRAVKQLHPEEMPENALDFQRLLQNPDTHIGRAVRITGHVRRAVRIEVSEPFLLQQYGLDHYFELDMFVPLGGGKVVVNPPKVSEKNPGNTDDGAAQPIVYENRFPLTVCVANLPCSESEIENRSFIVQGFFFKLWNYHSSFTDRNASGVGQISPLIIALAPANEESSTASLDAILAISLLVVIGAGAVIAWFFFYSDKRSGAYFKRYRELPRDLNFEEVDKAVRN